MPKRTSDDDDGSAITSARTSDLPQTHDHANAVPEPPAPRIQLPTLLNNDMLQVQEMNHEFGQYNAVLGFFPAADLIAASRTASGSASTFAATNGAILRAREDIADTLRDAQARMEVVKKDLREGQAQMLKKAAASDPHWYQNSDIMLLDVGLIFDVFGEYPIEDAAHFKDYLCEAISGFLNKPAILTVDGEELARARALMFEKVFACYGALRSSTDLQARRPAVSFSVFMITMILPKTCWDNVWNTRIFNNWRSRIYEECKHLFRYLDNVLTPPQSDADGWWTESRPFLNAASMYRELRAAYHSHNCQLSVRSLHWDPEADNSGMDFELFCPSDRSYGNCFHYYTLRLLRVLHRHARREVRERTLLAANSHLPVELTDHIFERALRAEALPAAEDICLHRPTEERKAQGRPSMATLRGVFCFSAKQLSRREEQWSFNTILIADKDREKA